MHLNLNSLKYLFIISLFLYPKVAFCNGIVIDSLDPVPAGRGGANLTNADNGALIHDNPAALVNMPPGKSIEASLLTFYPETKYENQQGSDYSKHQFSHIPTFTFIYKKSELSKFAFGVGLFSHVGFGADYHLNHSADRKITAESISFGKQKYFSRVSLLNILTAFSYKATKKLSIGFAVGPSFQQLSLEMPLTMQTGAFQGVNFIGDVDSVGDISFSYTLGAQYKISENTTLGLSFVSESKTTLNGDADLTLPVELGGARLLTDRDAEYDFKTNYEYPRSIGVVVSHKAGNATHFYLICFGIIDRRLLIDSTWN